MNKRLPTSFRASEYSSCKRSLADLPLQIADQTGFGFLLCLALFLATSSYAQSNWITVAISQPVREGEINNVNAIRLTSQQSVAEDTVVFLGASLPNEIQLPPSVTLLAGQMEVVMPVTPVDDLLIDGPQVVQISGTNSSFTVVPGNLTVLDNETAAMSLVFPAALTEGQYIAAQLNVQPAPDRNILAKVQLTPADRFSAPSSVSIPAGRTNVFLTIRAVENAYLEWTVPANLTVTVDNWLPGSADFLLLDNESTNLSLTVPASASESAGTLKQAGRVGFGRNVRNDIEIQLQSSAPDQLVVPATVVIPSGQSNTVFDLGVLDDNLPETNVTVSVKASARLSNQQASMMILDDDPESFELSIIPSPQYVGVSFTNRLRALGVNHQPLSAGTFPIQLAIESRSLTNSLAPITVSNGVADFNVTPTDPMMSAFLVAAGRGIRSTAGPFSVIGSLGRTIDGPVKDAAWVDSRLFATIPDGASVGAGQLVNINPVTGELTPWSPVSGGISSTGAYSGMLAASPYGDRIFVSGGQGDDVQEWDRQNGALSNRYVLPQGQICADLAITRANPWRVLVATVTKSTYSVGNSILLNELLQSQTVPARRLRSVLADGLPPETFYHFQSYQLGEWKTSADGVVSERSLSSGPAFSSFLPLATAEGRLFAASGLVTEVASASALGSLSVPAELAAFPARGRMVADLSRREIVIASPAGSLATRLQSFGINDLQLHREAFVPVSFSTPRRIFLCGTNLLALVAGDKLSLVPWPPAPPASTPGDLAVLPQTPNTSPVIGGDWTWSVVVTNGGLVPVTDVRLRVFLATNLTVIATNTLQEKVWTETNSLHAWLPSLAPASSALISFTICPSSGGYTTNLFFVSGNEDDLNWADNQSSIVTYISPSGAPESVENVRLPMRELVSDRYRHRIYALARTAGTNECTLYSLNSTTLEPKVLRLLPGVATALRLSEDGRFLYVAEQGGDSLRRIDLQELEPDLRFQPFENAKLFDFQVAPFDARTIVAVARAQPQEFSFETTIACFRDAQRLPRVITYVENTSTPASGMRLQFDPATSALVLARSTAQSDTDLIRLVGDGLELSRHYLCGGAAAGFLITGGKLYTGFGNEMDATNGCWLRSLPIMLSGYGLLGLDRNTDRLVRLQNSSGVRVEVYDRQNLGRLGNLYIGGSAAIDSIAILEDSRIALAANDGRIFVLNLALNSGAAPADLSIQWTLQPAIPKVGQPMVITIAVTNLGPSNAIAPAVTFEAPSSFTREAVSPSAAYSINSLPLLWAGNPLAPGQGQVFEVRGKFTAAGYALMAAGASDRSLDPLTSNNRVSEKLPVAYGLSQGQGSLLNFAVLDATRDPLRHGILAIVSGNHELAGTIVAVDLATGLVTGNWSVGKDPTRLIMADDNRTLYVLTDAATRIARVDAQTMNVEASILAEESAGAALTFNQLVVNPGAPNQIAAFR